jgi:hypothetical protein
MLINYIILISYHPTNSQQNVREKISNDENRCASQARSGECMNKAEILSVLQKPQHLNFINESTICKMEICYNKP